MSFTDGFVVLAVEEEAFRQVLFENSSNSAPTLDPHCGPGEQLSAIGFFERGGLGL